MSTATPEQANALRSWADQRDEILREIGQLETRRRELDESVVAASASFADLQVRIGEARGRLAEIDAAEEIARASVAADVAAMHAEKSALDVAVTSAKAELASVREEHDRTLGNIADLAAFRDATFGKLREASEAADASGRVSREAMEDVAALLDRLKAGVRQILDLNAENVGATNEVIRKLPAMLVELQRHKLIRVKL